MQIPQLFKTTLAVFMAFVMSNITLAVSAEEEMIPTQAVVTQLNRAQTEENVRNFLARSDVRSELIKRGLSADEAGMRLATLSDSELKQLSTQMEAAQYGGDILFTILIIVLIIFLIKRI